MNRKKILKIQKELEKRELLPCFLGGLWIEGTSVQHLSVLMIAQTLIESNWMTIIRAEILDKDEKVSSYVWELWDFNHNETEFIDQFDTYEDAILKGVERADPKKFSEMAKAEKKVWRRFGVSEYNICRE